MSTLLTALAWLFLPVWLTGVVGGILLAIRAKRGLAEKERATKIGKRITIITICYIFSTIGVSFLLDHVHANAWRRMLAQHPSRLILTGPTGGPAVEINDPKAIDQLLNIVVNTKHVSAHHSHPIPLMTLSFPQFNRTGSLGRDSGIPHEFWGPLGQFRSEELESWLQTYWLRDSNTSSQPSKSPR